MKDGAAWRRRFRLVSALYVFKTKTIKKEKRNKIKNAQNITVVFYSEPTYLKNDLLYYFPLLFSYVRKKLV